MSGIRSGHGPACYCTTSIIHTRHSLHHSIHHPITTYIPTPSTTPPPLFLNLYPHSLPHPTTTFYPTPRPRRAPVSDQTKSWLLSQLSCERQLVAPSIEWHLITCMCGSFVGICMHPGKYPPSPGLLA